MSDKLLQQIFKRIYGKPAWLVTKGYGSGFSLQFGRPKLKIGQRVVPLGLKKKFPHRMVRVRGEWDLFIFCCDWIIRQGKGKICDSNSKTKKINQGCVILNGQILRKMMVNPKTWHTDFHFDLDGHLQTKPYKNEDEPSEMWSLYCPNKKVFSLRSDGNYSYQLGSTPHGEKTWKPLTVGNSQ